MISRKHFILLSVIGLAFGASLLYAADNQKLPRVFFDVTADGQRFVVVIGIDIGELRANAVLFEDEDECIRGEIVEYRGATIVALVRQRIRNKRDRAALRDRSLADRIELAHAFDRITEELDADWQCLRIRKDIDDTASNGTRFARDRLCIIHYRIS